MNIGKFIIVLMFFSVIICGCKSTGEMTISGTKEVSGEGCLDETGKEQTAAYNNSDTKDKDELEVTDDTDALQPVTQAGLIVVYVCGAVNSPGVYELENDSRIADAVSMAGGLLQDADSDSINLAGRISDGMKIRIPFEGEILADENNDGEQSTSGNIGEDNVSAESTNEKININNATKEQLMTLSGVGESKANAIIEYRNTKGTFKTIEEIMNIEGIKEGVFNKIKDSICAE